MKMNPYVRFGLMILTSIVVMFGLKYLTTYEASHIYFSETRMYMAFLMGAAMAVIMLGYMLGMYKNRKWNTAIFISSGVVLVIALYLVRSQILVDDKDYMEAMIPHHSIAILTSERAQIDDQRVRELADEIIRAQRREIKEMKWLIEDITNNGIADTATKAGQRPVPDFQGEL